MHEVEVEGKVYKITTEQKALVDTVLPANYEKLSIKGIQFPKYNEDGHRIDKKEEYNKYLATGNIAVVDSFTYVPPEMVNIVDNDLEPSQIQGEFKDVEDALDYEGEE